MDRKVYSLAGNQRGKGEPPREMTINQLAERAGVPARRIRYYVAEELMPPPLGRGRAAHYTAEHLDRLREIVTLREVNLSLDEIRHRLGESQKCRPRRPKPREAGQWRRWQVAPGVEIHAREDLDTTQMATVRVLVGVAHHILSDPDAAESSEGADPEQ